MNTISQVVEQIVIKQPYMVELLSDELINLSSFARKIQPQVKKTLLKEVSEGSIVMALKRLTPKLQENNERQKIAENIYFSDIMVRANLSDFTFENSPNLIFAQKELLKKIALSAGSFYTVSRGVLETTLVVSGEHSESLQEIFSNEKLLYTTNGLSGFTVKLPKSNTEMPGLYYQIFKQIAWAGINIYEVISTTNEITILIHENDVNKTFSVFSDFGK